MAPRFEAGQIIRYGEGTTALMRVTEISPNHGGFGPRYYGRQFFGGAVGAYETDCTTATANEEQRYLDCERRESHSGGESGSAGGGESHG
jgi:hypothetical protein